MSCGLKLPKSMSFLLCSRLADRIPCSAGFSLLLLLASRVLVAGLFFRRAPGLFGDALRSLPRVTGPCWARLASLSRVSPMTSFSFWVLRHGEPYGRPESQRYGPEDQGILPQSLLEAAARPPRLPACPVSRPRRPGSAGRYPSGSPVHWPHRLLRWTRPPPEPLSPEP